jgi:YVTN family beta-propeller protein
LGLLWNKSPESSSIKGVREQLQKGCSEMKVKLLMSLNRLAGRLAWQVVPLLLAVFLGLSACTGLQSPASGQGVNNGIPNTGSNPTATNNRVAGQAAATPTGPATEKPAASQAAGPKAYIGLFKENAVAVFDTGTNQVIKTIPIPTGPHGLVITPDGRWVFVSSDGDSKISVIDTGSDTVIKSIEVGKMPHGLAITPDGRLVLAAVFGTSQVVFINSQSYEVVGQVSVPSPHNIAISPDGQTAYVAAQKQGATGLSVINISQRAQTTFIPLDKTPRALNFSPDGKLLYFTEAGVNAVQALNPVTNQVIAQIDVGASPHHPLFVPDGSMALVVSQGPGELDFIAPETNVAFLSLAVGKMPHWIAVNPQGTTAWVTNEASNTVSVIDLNKFTVTATIPVGDGPRKLVVQPRSPGAVQNQPAGQSAITVFINGMAFKEASVTIKAGQSITWINQDAIAHTVTDDQGSWDSGPIDPGKSYQMTLTKPGQYSYHCSIHPFMTGKITVTQ